MMLRARPRLVCSFVLVFGFLAPDSHLQAAPVSMDPSDTLTTRIGDLEVSPHAMPWGDQPVPSALLQAQHGGNLAEALAPFGIERDAIPTAFNVFMNVPVNGGSGTLAVDPPTSQPGEAIRFRAHMDLVIGLTACSAYASNGGSFRPIHYRIEA